MRISRVCAVAAIASSLACGGGAVAPEGASQTAERQEPELLRLSKAVHAGNLEALDRLRFLAESGVAEAQLALAASYANVPALRDEVESAKWYLAAAHQGLAVAQASIGADYLRGRGVEKDEERGLFWLRLAADQGQWLGVATLGDHYRGERRDEPGDFVQAYRWYAVGLRIAEPNEREAIIEILSKRRDQVAERMSAEEIAEGERLAATWVQRDWNELKSRLDGLG